MGIIELKPRKPQNHSYLRGVRDEKLQEFVMITGGNKHDWFSAVRNVREVLTT